VYHPETVREALRANARAYLHGTVVVDSKRKRVVVPELCKHTWRDFGEGPAEFLMGLVELLDEEDVRRELRRVLPQKDKCRWAMVSFTPCDWTPGFEVANQA
jgi:hypothetical protein